MKKLYVTEALFQTSQEKKKGIEPYKKKCFIIAHTILESLEKTKEIEGYQADTVEYVGLHPELLSKDWN